LAGAVNVPVNDKFGFRAAAFLRSDDGFIDSLGNNPIPSLTDPTMFTSNTRVAEKINAIDTTGGRITALIAPSDSFSIELMALGQKIEADEANVIDADPDTLEPLYGTLAQSSYHPSGTDTEYQVSSVSLDWDLGGFSIESISSYTTLDSNALLEADTLLGPTLTFLFGDPVTRPLGSIQTTDVTTDKFSQEFRLISADSDTFEWLLGAYYTDEESLILQHISAVESGTETIPTDLPEIAFATISSDYKELAFFANATWYLTPQFEISLGARSSSNDQNASQIILSPVLGDSTPPDAASSDSPFTWSFAPRFKINDETSIYARVATGFRPGGPNVLPLNPPPGTPSTFDSDTLTSYEVGIKTDGSGALVSLDFALYYLDWEDIQLFVRINDIGVNTNGETAESKGAEIAAKFAPTDRLTVSLTAAYTDAKLTANTDPPNEIPVVGGMDGDPLPYVPEWSFGLSGDYEWPVMGDATAYVGGTYGYTGDRPSAFNNRDSNGNIREADAYNLVNLRGGLETDRWSVEVFGKNLTDARGSNSTGGAGSLPNGATSIGLIQPRTYGVSVGMKF
jgi:outer membrane receptor protein involved in Fe transport